ncbi:hypothetical protein E7Z59_05985 [Robertkochia marina]|uniref:TraB/GumN family protein n=1 Tax=Robertkochia marina TaxID=1227945 RepID=A0A4S3M3W6_9FLAO|nr:DUF5694 domain-containing protein [Robertkochia marina]THD69874.1 hypothetical protein E7Z59_05985 [Robertkochia marina]TRZ46779.1 hypothetical protein D3A96_04215 [Robertkochia marina]
MMAQQNNTPELGEIAFLGVFHFAGTNDMVSLNIDDLKSKKRQEEIQSLVDSMVALEPHKVILEYPYGKTKLDSLYAEYRKGNHQLSINERQQLGFRIAHRLGHEHIYVADHPMDIGFGPLMKYLEESEQTFKLDTLIKEANTLMRSWENLYEKGSLSDLLYTMNAAESDNENKNIYLEVFNIMGGDQNNYGVSVVSKWWERNFHIMKNIDLIMEPNDRALVIFGQGHTAILKDLYRGRSDVKVIDVLPYLRE